FKKYDNTGNILNDTGRIGEHYARRYSPIGQGFIVEGLATGKVYFRNKYREFKKENPHTSEFKTAVFEENKEDIPMLRLNLEFPGKYVRQLILAFHPEATSEVDRAMDAKNISPLETDAGWKINNEMFLIDIRENRDQPVPFLISTT